MSPEELRRFHDGDDAMYRELIAMHSPQLVGVAVRITGHPALAHEAVQDAWVRAFQQRHSFSASGSFIGWMLMILRSVIIDGQRSERRRDDRETRFVAESASSATQESHYDTIEEPGNATRYQAVLGALAGLSDRQRDVVTMRLLEGKNVEECASRIGIATGTVKATLHQALVRLRSTLLQNDQ